MNKGILVLDDSDIFNPKYCIRYKGPEGAGLAYSEVEVSENSAKEITRLINLKKDVLYQTYFFKFYEQYVEPPATIHSNRGYFKEVAEVVFDDIWAPFISEMAKEGYYVESDVMNWMKKNFLPPTPIKK